MKVIKRDGRTIEFDRAKIELAIEKANKEVKGKEKATKEEINEIIAYIEDIDKKRILVEDIQDIIEQKLMEFDKYELAKKYIVYRYTRTLVRKSNTTDGLILGLIRSQNRQMENNPNKNIMTAVMQRNYIAGEVSRDLTKRILLPEKISKAHEEGILHFHDAEYFVQPIINSCLVNIEDMLDNGTAINGIKIESPTNFKTACIILTQIISNIANNQYGEQIIDLKYLGKYLRKSREKINKNLTEKYSKKISNEIIKEMVNERVKEELSSGIQTIINQIYTTVTANGQAPVVTLVLNVDSDDEYKEENSMIIEEFIKQKNKGIQNEDGISISPENLKFVYSPDENQNTNIVAKYDEKFNQGIVTINLHQIGILCKGNEDEFWKMLDERLELCREALMYRHYALLGTPSDISPIHWQYGAISRLKKGEKIDKLLKGGNSTLTLGYFGIYELTQLIKDVFYTTPEANEFTNKVKKYLKEIVTKWKKENDIEFKLIEVTDQKVYDRFARIDKERYGITIENVIQIT